MLQSVIAIGVAPMLTGLATLAARRWGPLIGGTVSAFPAIVGPTLLIVAFDHGPMFAARAANGTLLGLVALAAFAVAYGQAALRSTWRRSLAAGWAAAAASATGVGLLIPASRSPVGLLVAGASLSIAYATLPSTRSNGRPTAPAPAVSDPRPAVLSRMAVTAVLVSALSAAPSALGAEVGGLLAALPVLASVIAVFTHRESGAEALIGFLRGTLVGMAAFVVFCEVLAAMIVEAGIAPAFLAATAVAVAVQSVVASVCYRQERMRYRPRPTSIPTPTGSQRRV